MINYKGELGEFEYDETQFNLTKTDDNVEYLKYIGAETDGTAIQVPQGITDVRYMFAGSNIESSPVFPDGVTSAEGTFMGCGNLKYVNTISPNVKNMDSCYSYCTSLEQGANMPDSVISANFAYDGCSNLKIIPNFSDNLKYANGMCANCSDLKSLPDFPAGLEEADSICLNAKSMEELPQMPDTIRNITCAFEGTPALDKASPELLEKMTKSVKKDAFYNDEFNDDYDDSYEDVEVIEKVEEEVRSSVHISANTKDFVQSHGKVYDKAVKNTPAIVHDGHEVEIAGVTDNKSVDLDIGK